MRKHRLTFALAMGLGLTGLPSAGVAADQAPSQAERSGQEAEKARDRSGNIAKDGTAEVGEAGRKTSNETEAARKASKEFFGDADPGNDVARGERVREIQTTLREEGYYKGEIDGITGPATAQALRQFQTEQGVTATGRLDSKTSKQLDKRTKKHRSSQGDQFGKAGQATERAMDKTGSAAKRGAEATGKGVRTGAQSVGAGAGAAVEHGGRGAAKVGEKTADAAKATGSAIADFFSDDDPGDNAARTQRVRNAQEKLKSEGYYHANVDGAPGPETAEAIREYQRAEGLTVNGQLNSETVAALDIKK